MESSLIGGGARSRFWGRCLASVLDRPLHRFAASETGPAFGAARLARLSLGQDATDAVLLEPAIADVIEPDPQLVDAYRPRIEAFRRLYKALRESSDLPQGIGTTIEESK